MHVELASHIFLVDVNIDSSLVDECIRRAKGTRKPCALGSIRTKFTAGLGHSSIINGGLGTPNEGREKQ